MKIKKMAVAGTLESSDAMVTVEPWEDKKGIDLQLDSVVIHQYGNHIKKVVLDTLGRLEVKDVRIMVVDKGALDCTLRARVECAIFRSNGLTEQLPWGGAIHS